MRKSIIIWCMGLLLCCPALVAQDCHKARVGGNYDQELISLILIDWGFQNRVSGLRIVVDEETLNGARFTGKIPRTTLEQGLEFLLTGTGLGFTFVEDCRVEILPLADLPEPPKEEIQEVSRFNVTVRGKVIDRQSGESLPYASVEIIETQRGTNTNVDGHFALFQFPSDTSLVKVTYLGYQTRTFRVQPGMDLESVIIPMDVMERQLAAIVIEAEQEEQLIKASSGISRVSLSPATVAILPSLGEKDVFRSLQLLPGISGTGDNSSGLYVRGGTPDQNLVLFDGFTVYHVDHLFGFLSAFNPNAVKDVQMYKGGFGAQYGGRLSSVVDLTGKDGNTEAFNMGAGISLLSANAYLESPFANGKGSFLVAGRRSFPSGLYQDIFDKFVNTTPQNQPEGNSFQGGGRQIARIEVQPESYFYDLNAKVSYRPKQGEIISLSFYNGQDDLDNSRITDPENLPQRFQDAFNQNTFRDDVTDLTRWGNWGSSIRWGKQWGDRLYSNLIGSYSQYYSERDQSRYLYFERDTVVREINNGTEEDNNIIDYTLKLDNRYQLSGNNTLKFGLQGTYNEISYQYIQDDTLTILDRLGSGILMSAYAEDEWLIGNKLLINGGVRASYYDVTDEIYWEPRASFSWQMTPRVKLKGAWGKYYQFATRVVREDIQQGTRDFWVLADGVTTPIASAEHYILGASYETGTWLFDVEAYYKPMAGISEYTSRFVRTRGTPGEPGSVNYEEQFFEGTGLARGVEFLIQKKLGAYAGWIGYTLSKVEHEYDIYGEDPFPALHDQTHEAKWINTYTLNNWTFAGTFVYATGKPYTSPTGYYSVLSPDGTETSFLSIGDKNGARLPDYHRLDLSATYRLQLREASVDLGLSIFNAYGRKNIWYNEYEVIDGELLETAVTLQGFTPSLFATWKLR